MQSISDNADFAEPLTLLEDMPLVSLRRAYFRIGQLNWSEDRIQKALRKQLLVAHASPIWTAHMTESDERLHKIRMVGAQVRVVLREKEANQDDS
jgi:hypothetical protein